MIAPTPPRGSPPTPPSDSHGRSEPPPDKPDPDKLSDEIAELAAHIDAARYRLLVLIRQFAELERWGPGFKSCDHWLSWRIGIALPTAREHVRVARALAELPLLSAAMERGEISFSRARAITRVATPANEERLVGFALQATAMQLEHLVKAWRKVDRLEDEQVRHERRHLMLYGDDDGSYVLRGRLDLSGIGPTGGGGGLASVLRNSGNTRVRVGFDKSLPPVRAGARLSFAHSQRYNVSASRLTTVWAANRNFVKHRGESKRLEYRIGSESREGVVWRPCACN